MERRKPKVESRKSKAESRKPKVESLPSEPSPAQSRRGPARANIRAIANAHAAVKERDADRAVRDQLQRIVASATFQQVDRLKRFLTFVVDETIAGRRRELKEYVIGVQVFGKEESVDPRTDPIVSGSVRRSGQRVRITAQLIDGGTGSYVWSESVDSSVDDALGSQEQVARAIVAKLEAETGDAAASSSRRPSENLAAHNLYLQGRYHLNQRTDEGLRKALDFFEKALAEDAESALAHSGFADAYGLLAHYGVLGPAEVWTKAAASAAAAVMLDDRSAEAHTSLAHVKSTQDWDWIGAEREFQRAIACNPRYATAHQ